MPSKACRQCGASWWRLSQDGLCRDCETNRWIELAVKSGIIMVQASKRKWLIVRIAKNKISGEPLMGSCHISGAELKRATYFHGELVYQGYREATQNELHRLLTEAIAAPQ